MQSRHSKMRATAAPHQLQDAAPFRSGTTRRQPAATPSPSPSRGSLPPGLQAGMENLSGIGMADVKVHYNSPQPARLEALAFARGSDIHLGPGQERHLPHEAWHVVQQKQGRVNATTQAKGVSINADPRLEHEADRMGAAALQGTTRDVPWQPAAASDGVVHQLRPVVQRLKMSELPLQGGYSSLTSHASWPAKAEAYEKRLGIYAYSHASAAAAVNSGLSRMKAVIDKHYQASLADANDKLALYKEVFTKDDEGSAGQIGQAVSQNDIDTLLTGGNLRERMTAFYNAAYYNSPSGGAPLRGFKQILNAILFEKEADLATTLALDSGDLAKKADFLKTSPLRQSTKLLSSFTSKGYNFADDPFALGNLTLAKETGGTIEMGLSQSERLTRPQNERAAETRAADDYEALGIGLSAREKAYTAAKLGKNATDADYGTTKLPWLEGHTYYKMQKNSMLGYSWINSIRDTLHMPVVAGVSGTTTRMLTAYKWLGCANPENFRLALMGWMLPAWDHSLYEIMRGSHLAGVKPAADSDLNDVVDMYMNIAPLSTNALRTHVALNGQFPHEAVYMERTKAAASLDDDAFISAHESNKTAATIKYNTSGTGIAGFSAAHATALYNYTSGIHSLMNAALSLPSLAAKQVIHGKLFDSAQYQCRAAWFRAHAATLSTEEKAQWKAMKDKPVEPIDVLKKGNRVTSWKTLCASYTTLAAVDTLLARMVTPWITSIIDPLFDEMKVHANMTTEALKALPPADGADVWRGDWTSMFGSRYEKDSVITHDTLTSYSRNEDTAKGFAQSGRMSYKVLVKLTLSGKGGRDIDVFSKFPENEVLMMPGSKIRITKVSWGKDAKGEDIKLCEAVEV